MEVKKVKIQNLKPSDYNPRKKLKPGDKEYEKIKKSILTFGYVDPIIINSDMTIIGGHQRYTVLKDLEYTEVECVIVNLDKDKEKSLNIALNKIAGQWDIPKLKDLLQELDTGAFDIEITGFDHGEIEDMMTKNNSPADIDELLNDLDISKAIDKPIWATIRTDAANQEVLEKAMTALENCGIKVERSYET